MGTLKSTPGLAAIIALGFAVSIPAAANAPRLVYFEPGEVTQHLSPRDPIAEQAGTILRETLGARPRIVTDLGRGKLFGPALGRELRRRGMRGYRVQLNVRQLTFGEVPRTAPGPLQVESSCSVSILLVRLPEGWMAFHTDVGATLQQNVLRGSAASYEARLKRDALRGAIGRAVDEALGALDRPVSQGGAR